MSEIYLIRHAQASYMSENYDQLSPKGEKQSAILGHHLAKKKISFDHLFVGALVRQKHTLEIVTNSYKEKDAHLPVPEISALLNEHKGPTALKLSYDKLLQEDKQVQEWVAQIEATPSLKHKNTMLFFKYFMNKWVNGNIDVPEVESWDQFRKRIKEGLATILEKTAPKSKIGVFTSGGVIAAITAEILGIQDETKVADLNYAVRNTSISKILYSKSELSLLSFNEVPHLEKEMITFV